jgi:hypothetical protein
MNFSIFEIRTQACGEKLNNHPIKQIAHKQIVRTPCARCFRNLDSSISKFSLCPCTNMADVDEDAIHPVSSGAGLVDIDLSDETQDFRFLNSLSV